LRKEDAGGMVFFNEATGKQAELSLV